MYNDAKRSASLRRMQSHSHSVTLLTLAIACGPCCQLVAEATTVPSATAGGPERHSENVEFHKPGAQPARCPPLEDPFQRLSDALLTPTEVVISPPSPNH